MKIKMSLNNFLSMGGYVDTITEAFDSYNSNMVNSVSFSHITEPSFGNPNGVRMFKVGNHTVAASFVEVQVEVVLHNKHL